MKVVVVENISVHWGSCRWRKWRVRLLRRRRGVGVSERGWYSELKTFQTLVSKNGSGMTLSNIIYVYPTLRLLWWRTWTRNRYWWLSSVLTAVSSFSSSDNLFFTCRKLCKSIGDNNVIQHCFQFYFIFISRSLPIAEVYLHWFHEI